METKNCPLCNCPVRIIKRADGAADHYDYFDKDERHHLPNPISPILADYLRAERKGKKTVAIVGSDWMSGPWAPWGEIEVWGMNMLHGLPWYKVEDTTRWYQIHVKSYLTNANEGAHWEWLQEDHPFPIYMQMVYDDVPSSVMYPLRDIQNKLLGNLRRGEKKMEKLFSSSPCYQIAQALYEDFERIEIYGISLVHENEYAYQREVMAYWMGKADGMGVEVWTPETCALLVQPLYGYEVTRNAKTGEIEYDITQELQTYPEAEVMIEEIRENFKPILECPLCGADKFREYFVHDSYDYVTCGCGMVFQPMYMTPEQIRDYYKDTYRSTTGTYENIVTVQNIQNERSRGKKQIRFMNGIEPKKHLDIGSSTGTFLKLMKDRYGCEGIGVEPGDVFREYSIEQGNNVVSDISEVDGKFDFVSVSHVLEHLTNPLEMLETVRGLLEDDGCLFVEVPKMMSDISHPLMFFDVTLEKMLNKAGFKVAELTLNEHIMVLAKKVGIIPRSESLADLDMREHIRGD